MLHDTTRPPRRDTIERRDAPALRITLSQRESDLIFRAAQQAGMRMSEWARPIVLAAARNALEPTTD